MPNLFEEVTLTTPAIKDFQICALLYDYRHRQELYEPIIGREILAQKYDNTLKKVLSFFFYKKQAGLTPSYNALVNRWEKLWFPKEVTAYELALEQHETWHNNMASYSNAAVMALMKFHEDFENDLWEPLLISESFLVPLTDQVRIAGTFDLVLRRGKNHKVLLISGRQKRPTMGQLLLDFAVQKYAFDSRHDDRKSVKYGLYDVGSTRPGFVTATPTKKDVQALFYWANQAVNSEVYAPRRGLTAYCRGCPFDAPCSKFTSYPSIETS